MEQVQIDNLILEVTRKCNMKCNHCLRGDAENFDMTTDIIDKILLHTKYISEVTFTGGEPLLNTELINYFIDEADRLGVEVGNFYIATNGTIQTKEVFITIARLYAFCTDRTISSLVGSNDGFHLDEREVDWSMFEAFSFFRLRNQHPYEERNLISQGRASGMSRTVNPNFQNLELELDNNMIMGTFYVNVNGDVMACCDLAYESQDNHIIGSVFDFESIEMEEN